MSLLILKLLLNSLIINTPNYISFKILINKVFLSFFIFFFLRKIPLRGRDHIIAFSANRVGTHQECLVEQTPSKLEKETVQLAAQAYVPHSSLLY